MSRSRLGIGVALLLASVALVASCSATSGGEADASDGHAIVATTTLLADVVRAVTPDEVEVTALVPAGVDPHTFQLSARDVQRLRDATALVHNGGGLEGTLADVLEAATADGVPSFSMLDAIEEPLSAAADADGHASHGGPGAVDPHFFTDPVRMSEAVGGLGAFLATVLPDDVDRAELATAVQGYQDELAAIDAELDDLLVGIPDDRRILVTNHDAFSYFADRYGFEVLGTVIPAGSSADGVDARSLAELADAVRRAGVPAVFGEESASEELLRTLVGEVGSDVVVVELFAGSLSSGSEGPHTYLDYLRMNAVRIYDALGG